jgi:probable HAF family extracellular repeat protein
MKTTLLASVAGILATISSIFPANSDTFTYTNIYGPTGPNAGASTNSINNKGEIVGYFNNSSGGFAGSYLYSAGTYTNISPPGAAFPIPGAAIDINDKGQIVGYFTNSSGLNQGFRYNDGNYTTIAVPGSSVNFPFAINNRGEITGYFSTGFNPYSGFLYKNGT